MCLDTAALDAAKLNPDYDCLPPIEFVDLLSYLVLDASYYTKKQFNNFKSLKAYHQLVCGFETYMKGLQISEKYVVIRKV